jgi:hypothetical protein
MRCLLLKQIPRDSSLSILIVDLYDARRHEPQVLVVLERAFAHDDELWMKMFGGNPSPKCHPLSLYQWFTHSPTIAQDVVTRQIHHRSHQERGI